MPTPEPWLGLVHDAEGRWHFELAGPLTRFDGKLYGGTGLAVVTALAEIETGREALWATVQFVASADVGERIDCQVEVLAQGHRTTQLRMTATVGDRTVLAALASAGLPRADGLDLQIGQMPAVVAPEDSPEWSPRVPFTIPDGQRGWLDSIDLREARLLATDGSADPIAAGLTLWARMRSATTSRASLGFVADLVPSAVVRAAGRTGGGRSLDNTMRFGPTPTTEWVLVELDPHFASAGYVHGAARLWGQDGTLLGVASQTAVGIHFD